MHLPPTWLPPGTPGEGRSQSFFRAPFPPSGLSHSILPTDCCPDQPHSHFLPSVFTSFSARVMIRNLSPVGCLSFPTRMQTSQTRTSAPCLLPCPQRQGRAWPSVLRLVTQSCPTLTDPMDCGPPGSSVHGISRQES